MGSAQPRVSKLPELNSDAIERYYAALTDSRRIPTEDRTSHDDNSNREQRRLFGYDTHNNASRSEPRAAVNNNVEPDDSSIDSSLIKPQDYFIRSLPYRAGSMSVLDFATVHLAQAVSFSKGARNRAIEVLKNIDLKIVAQAILEWTKAHPWETAALVVPLILLACTPGFLGLLGFGAGGIAAGSIAAGIQAGLGNVAAGSLFATLTSAGMGGFGVPIVLGGVWAVSSIVGWGFATWKRWRGKKPKESEDAKFQQLLKAHGESDDD